MNISIKTDRVNGGDVAAAYRQLLAATPDLRIRDAADRLGVSEAELVATNVDAAARPLVGSWAEMLTEFPKLGRVMTLTRNAHVVHEKVGAFEDVSAKGRFGLVLGPDIDLRIFLDRWHHGFAVEKEVNGQPRRSLQFFDCDGTAVHKVFLRNESDVEAYDAIVGRFAAPSAEPALDIRAREPKTPDRPDDAIDLVGFRAAWAALKDTHEFFPMLRKFEIGRLQALRLIGTEFAYRTSLGAFRQVVEDAADDGTEIMIFVGSPGCIQIHTGPVKKLKTFGTWFNVLDPGFNLHLREDAIASAWVVRKPTEDGIVTSLEIFDAEGEVIAFTFGKRKPGEPELAAWRRLVERLPREPEPV